MKIGPWTSSGIERLRVWDILSKDSKSVSSNLNYKEPNDNKRKDWKLKKMRKPPRSRMNSIKLTMNTSIFQRNSLINLFMELSQKWRNKNNKRSQEKDED